MCKVCFDAQYLQGGKVVKFEGAFDECEKVVHDIYNKEITDSDEEVVFILDEEGNYWYPKFDNQGNKNGIEIGKEF